MPTIFEMGTHAANETALYQLAADRNPPWQETAVLEFAKECRTLFNADKYMADGTSMQAWVERYEKNRPHILVHQANDMDDMALRLTAFLGDNGVRRATDLNPVIKSLGGDVDALKAAALDFGITNPFDLKQVGKAPGNIGQMIDAKKASDEADDLEARAKALRAAVNLAAPKVNGAERASNPWSQAGWNMTKQSSLVRAVGAEKGARIAASVGCVLGSTHPNPAYNK
jgi:hypothetical protein